MQWGTDYPRQEPKDAVGQVCFHEVVQRLEYEPPNMLELMGFLCESASKNSHTHGGQSPFSLRRGGAWQAQLICGILGIQWAAMLR